MTNTNQNELQHYGVLGMKWGVRRYQNKDGSLTPAGERHREKTGETGYHYKSWTTKHNDKLAAKYGEKINKAKTDKGRTKLENKKSKYERRANISRELDKREQAYAERVSVPGNIAARLLTNVGSKPYQQYLAMMNAQDKTGITKEKLIASIGTKLGGRVGSTLVKQIYVREGDREEKRRNRALKKEDKTRKYSDYERALRDKEEYYKSDFFLEPLWAKGLSNADISKIRENELNKWKSDYKKKRR